MQAIKWAYSAPPPPRFSATIINEWLKWKFFILYFSLIFSALLSIPGCYSSSSYALKVSSVRVMKSDKRRKYDINIKFAINQIK